MTVKMSKVGEHDTRIVSIPAKLIEEAGLDPSRDIKVERHVRPQEIVLVMKYDG